MPELPASPIAPKQFLEEWLPSAFAEAGLPPGSDAVDVSLGVALEGEGGGEWVLRINHGELTISAASREETAFTYVQSVDDWRGALWEGRGGAIGEAFGRFFRPGAEAAAGPAGALGGTPPPQALTMMERLDGSIRIVVTGEEQGDWAVAVRLGPGAVPEEPTCTLSIASADAAALARGELDPMQAFMGGQMVVTGDMTLMLQMQAALMQAAGGSPA